MRLWAVHFPAATAERVTSKRADVGFHRHEGNIHLKRKTCFSARTESARIHHAGPRRKDKWLTLWLCPVCKMRGCPGRQGPFPIGPICTLNQWEARGHRGPERTEEPHRPRGSTCEDRTGHPDAGLGSCPSRYMDVSTRLSHKRNEQVLLLKLFLPCSILRVRKLRSES